MRRRIIEELTYPRMMLLANLDVEECTQNQYFNPGDNACQRCEQGEECRWLNRNDDTRYLREDISNHLGIAPETLSRLIAKLRRKGLIEVDRRRIRLLNPVRLGLLAQGKHHE